MPLSWKEKLALWRRQDERQRKLDRLADIPELAKTRSIALSLKMTPAEIALGEILKELKAKYPDMRIIPQKPLRENRKSEKFYIADYYIPLPYNIVIEADGGYHKYRTAYDKRRDKTMIKHGVRVIRIKNEEILENPDKAKIRIEAALFVRSK